MSLQGINYLLLQKAKSRGNSVGLEIKRLALSETKNRFAPRNKKIIPIVLRASS